MSMIAKDNGGARIPPLEDGVYLAICSGLIDLGIQKSEQFNNESRKMMIQYQIIGEDIEFNGETIARKI